MNFFIIKDERKIQLIKNFIALISVKGIDFLIPLIIFPFLIKVLGFDKFGLLTFSLSVCLYMGSFIQYGFSITAVRDIARVKNNLVLLTQKFNNFFWTNILLLCISFFIFSVLVFIIPILKDEKALFFITFFLVGMQSVFPYWFFQGVEKMKLIAYINVITKFLYLISLLYFINGPLDYLYVYLLYAIWVMLGNIIAFIIIVKNFKIALSAPNLKEIKHIITTGRNAFITQFAPNLYNNTATFVLGLTVSNSLLGVYASAMKIIEALNSFGVIISSTFLPGLSRSLGIHLMYKRIMITVGIIICTLSYTYSTSIIELFVNNNINEIEMYFRCLIPMVFFVYFRLIYGPNFLMIIGEEKMYKNIILYTSLIFFIFSWYIIPVQGVLGAIYVLLGASGTMSILTYLYSKKIKGNAHRISKK